MGNVFMRFPGGRKKALTLSYDDGTLQDIRLIGMMKSYGLKGTFNISSGILAPEGTVYEPGTIHQRISRKEAAEIYRDNGMEVSVHGYTHPYLDQLPVNLCMEEIAKDRKELERLTKGLVRGMAYPYGRYREEVLQLLPLLGITYARTTKSSGQFGIPKDWLQLEATCHHNDKRLMELAHTFVETDLKKDPWLFYLWGHTFEFDRDDNWDVMERFIAYTGAREDIWYATNLEVYEYIRAYEQLVFSMDGGLVCNPSGIPVYFEAGDKIWCVESGKTMKLCPGVLEIPGLRTYT